MNTQVTESSKLEFLTIKDYWSLVQNPATRSGNPEELLRGAQSALRQFEDAHVRASALCVIIYRYLEAEDLRHLIDLDDLSKNYQVTKGQLRGNDDLPSLRWYLSLNMAVANLRLQLDQSELALATLQENVARKPDALLRGQPFTNVVKSAAAALGIMKYRDPHHYSSAQVVDLTSQFAGLGADIAANYRFENQWVYEELSLVFKTVYAIAKVHYLFKNTSSENNMPAITLLNEMDDSSIPNSFLRLLRRK